MNKLLDRLLAGPTKVRLKGEPSCFMLSVIANESGEILVKAYGVGRPKPTPDDHLIIHNPNNNEWLESLIIEEPAKLQTLELVGSNE